ncbi:hypothetical protein CRG98_027557 [Punica granatum]|uniref:CCT domain-containing protein n=1 Tax=Punica granatum TaxID=22663 RepID=A0A2I0J7B5_PUNGR|nr:hypothetical protein CRG98_027557 [Punica granatum]
MYADTGLMFPCFQNLYQEAQQFDDFCKPQKPNASLSKLFQSSTIMEYDLGGEGDLFKAPEPIIEEPIIGLDPMAAAISMISCGEDSILAQDLKVADIASLQNEPLFSEVFYDCRKDLLEKAATEATFSEALQIKIPPLKIDENQSVVNELTLDLPFQKSVSSGCLSSIQGAALKPNFLGFSGLDFGAVYGMRRAFSEGDIKRPILISNCTSEERKEKLSRYRNKKTKRNFGRKIKYACRKALADSQPRIRGRFAKTEESDISKKQ